MKCFLGCLVFWLRVDFRDVYCVCARLRNLPPNHRLEKVSSSCNVLHVVFYKDIVCIGYFVSYLISNDIENGTHCFFSILRMIITSKTFPNS